MFIDQDGKYIETESGFDLSISFGGKEASVSAWYLDPPTISPVVMDDFIGSVAQGAAVNFNNIFFNPHAHVTHTESLGHITKEFHSVNSIKHPLFYKVRVISISPERKENGDHVIGLTQLKALIKESDAIEALIIRTLPNDMSKLTKQYSHSNPAFIDVACASFLKSAGVKHLLIDLPSVDKEEDDGKLAFHHAFWGVPENPNYTKTITEFIFVQDDCLDGDYLLNLQVAPIENDASPSRPVLYKIFGA